MSLHGPLTQALFERALSLTPNGVSSNCRYLGPDYTPVITRGEGAYVWDADGRRLLDYRLAFGPIILGHAYPRVVQRVCAAIAEGTMFAATTPLEVRVIERIIRMGGVEMVRLSNTGSEATMQALRIARGVTGRERYIKFEGHYHGQTDAMLFSTTNAPLEQLGELRRPRSAPVSRGIPASLSEHVITLPFNDTEVLEECLARRAHEVAAIFVEPIMGNAACVMPAPGFLSRIRELCDQHGVLMVMDEVKTGFRIANGGAQEYFGVRADLVTYAKAMANGFPIAAIGGKRELMMSLSQGGVSHGGTYTGNTVGTAAADATLEILESEPVLDTINRRGRVLMDGLSRILGEQGVAHAMTGVPSMFGILMGDSAAPTQVRQYLRSELRYYENIIIELFQRGIHVDCPGEPWFLCYSHSEEDIAETLTRFREAVQAAKP
jgi:glutamate-1-semialdehyde 2,1-aminomutase